MRSFGNPHADSCPSRKGRTRGSVGNDLEGKIKRAVEEVKQAAGPHRSAIVLFGSASQGCYVPGRSDLNFLVVVNEIDLPLLDRFQSSVAAWSRRRIATPILVSPSFLAESTDSYPLEILGMMSGYRVLDGIDPFESLTLKKEDVRLQVEREVKAKSLFLRRGYMESCGKHQRLLACLTGALPALDVILRGMLFLNGADWRVGGEGLYARSAAALGSDAETVCAIHATRNGARRPNRAETIRMFDRTLQLLISLARSVERITSSG